jgi:hypothetical protein
VKTLKQMVKKMQADSLPEIELANFLDAFYRGPSQETVREEPPLLPEVYPHGAVINAYLAATAEYLCRRFGLPIPDWVFKPCRYLERPYFALEAASFRATLLLESPLEFRSRNLFVTANALSRASELSTLATAAIYARAVALDSTQQLVKKPS